MTQTITHRVLHAGPMTWLGLQPPCVVTDAFPPCNVMQIYNKHIIFSVHSKEHSRFIHTWVYIGQ